MRPCHGHLKHSSSINSCNMFLLSDSLFVLVSETQLCPSLWAPEQQADECIQATPKSYFTAPALLLAPSSCAGSSCFSLETVLGIYLSQLSVHRPKRCLSAPKEQLVTVRADWRSLVLGYGAPVGSSLSGCLSPPVLVGLRHKPFRETCVRTWACSQPRGREDAVLACN